MKLACEVVEMMVDLEDCDNISDKGSKCSCKERVMALIGLNENGVR